MSKSIVMSSAFGHLGVIVSLEGRIVFYHVVSCVDQCIPENPGATLRRSGVAGIKVSGLVYRWIQSCKRKQLTWLGEAVNVADLSKYHPAIDISNAGDGHNNGVESEHDFSHLRLDILYLPVQ